MEIRVEDKLSWRVSDAKMKQSLKSTGQNCHQQAELAGYLGRWKEKVIERKDKPPLFQQQLCSHFAPAVYFGVLDWKLIPP